MSVIVLGMMALYLVVASIAVLLVWKRTSRKLYRWMAVAIAVLLPTWDVVLSTVFFYAACPLFSKAEIYETAETDGIYYEGDHRNKVFIRRSWDGSEVNRIPLASSDIQKGYQYMESLVTLRKSYEDKEIAVSPPVVYRCIEGPKDKKRPWEVFAQCTPVPEIRSRYVVKSKSLQFALIEMDFMKISDRVTGRLMAEYREIAKRPYAGTPFYPFFTWLNWDHGEFRGGTGLVRCPRESQFFTFQYRVLKLKK
ncbi:MAG: hypothetical protein A4E72_00012 [Syntrophus sp. PtaU1.Bin208]|nr:MAG: hypothetical protein A4E72_00012 [Syntrophus sp. PtaU1.Bin208]